MPFVKWKTVKNLMLAQINVKITPTVHNCHSQYTWSEFCLTIDTKTINPNQIQLRGFDPLLLFFMNEIKNVSYSFSSSVIEYNSNENLLKAWSRARFFKNQHYVLSWYEENLTQLETYCIFLCPVEKGGILFCNFRSVGMLVGMSVGR